MCIYIYVYIYMYMYIYIYVYIDVCMQYIQYTRPFQLFVPRGGTYALIILFAGSPVLKLSSIGHSVH